MSKTVTYGEFIPDEGEDSAGTKNADILPNPLDTPSPQAAPPAAGGGQQAPAREAPERREPPARAESSRAESHGVASARAEPQPSREPPSQLQQAFRAPPQSLENAKDLQRLILAHGGDLGRGGIDGKIGPATIAALERIKDKSPELARLAQQFKGGGGGRYRRGDWNKNNRLFEAALNPDGRDSHLRNELIGVGYQRLVEHKRNVFDTLGKARAAGATRQQFDSAIAPEVNSAQLTLQALGFKGIQVTGTIDQQTEAAVQSIVKSGGQQAQQSQEAADPAPDQPAPSEPGNPLPTPR